MLRNQQFFQVLLLSLKKTSRIIKLIFIVIQQPYHILSFIVKYVEVKRSWKNGETLWALLEFLRSSLCHNQEFKGRNVSFAFFLAIQCSRNIHNILTVFYLMCLISVAMWFPQSLTLNRHFIPREIFHSRDQRLYLISSSPWCAMGSLWSLATSQKMNGRHCFQSQPTNKSHILTLHPTFSKAPLHKPIPK